MAKAFPCVGINEERRARSDEGTMRMVLLWQRTEEREHSTFWKNFG